MQSLLDIHPDEAIRLQYVGPSWIRTPDNVASSGDTFEATWGWVVRRRLGTWLRGFLVLAEQPQPDTCAGVKANGQPCTAKPRKGQAYCWHHEGQA